MKRRLITLVRGFLTSTAGTKTRIESKLKKN